MTQRTPARRRRAAAAAQLALLPMALTVLGVYIGTVLWSVRISFSSSKIFPTDDFVGLAQYQRLGLVKLGPKKEWDGVYRWQAGSHAGQAATLEEAKRGVEQAVLIGVSQLPLFDKN